LNFKASFVAWCVVLEVGALAHVRIVSKGIDAGSRPVRFKKFTISVSQLRKVPVGIGPSRCAAGKAREFSAAAAEFQRRMRLYLLRGPSCPPSGIILIPRNCSIIAPHEVLIADLTSSMKAATARCAVTTSVTGW
jgi:hypothetical protein